MSFVVDRTLIERLGSEADASVRATLLDEVLDAASDVPSAARALLDACTVAIEVSPVASLATTQALASWLARDSVRGSHALHVVWLDACYLEATIRSGDLGDYAGSIAVLEAAEQAIRLRWDGDAELAVARLAPRWVRALAFLDRPDEARQRYEVARERLFAAGEHAVLARLHADMAGGLWRSGDYDAAVEAVQLARRAFERAGIADVEWLPTLGQVEALALQSIGRLADAEAAFVAIIALCDAEGDMIRGASARTNLARVCYELGQPMRALELLDAARTVFVAAEVAHLALMVQLVRMDILTHLQRFRALLASADDALELPRAIASAMEWGQVHLSRAVALVGLGRLAEAREALAAAREMFARAGSAYWMAECDRREALVALERRELVAARTLASAAGGMFEAQGARWDAAKCRLVVVAAELAAAEDRGLPSDSSSRLPAILDELRAIDISAAPVPIAVQGQRLRSRALRLQGDRTAARAAARAAVDSLELLVGRIALGMRGEYLLDHDAVFGDAVSLALDEGDVPTALDYAERAKSRTVVDALAHGIPLGLQPRSADDARAVADVVSLRGEHERLARAWRTALDAEGEEASELEERVRRVERQLAIAWERLLVRGADYARQASVLHPFVADPRPALAAKETLLEYFQVEDRLLCFVVRSEQLDAHWLEARSDEVARLAARLRTGMTAVAATGNAGSAALRRHASHYLVTLYDALVRPVAASLQDATRLFVVPHGTLHFVPFCALHDGTASLVERTAVSQLPSSSLLTLLRSQESSVRRATGAAAFGCSLGGRLAAAPHEARAVADALGVAPQLESAATRGAMLDALATRDVVHLASHAVFRADEPLYAGIEAADGMLSVMDLAQAEVRARLVVLSACETGASALSGGDELRGLTSTLLARGATSVVVARWPIDDGATAALMRGVYAGLAEGASVDRALAMAQRSMARAVDVVRKEPMPEARWRHPFHWAGLAVMGDGALRPFEPKRAGPESKSTQGGKA